MTAWAPGVEVGPYALLSQIGAGGMGEVWKARDTRLGRTVAIKRLAVEHSARFEREARAIAALNHPHICQIYDIGPDYLVLEYIDGRQVRGPLPPEEVVRLAIQIADALGAAHRRGIVHRDLKPANIMLSDDHFVKLLDFGLARQLDIDDEATRTTEGAVLGTVAYMAPEQGEGKTADERSDVFSFGVVLYELLSGRRAFEGGTPVSTLAAILHKEPTPLEAPADLCRLVNRCLRKSPDDRFQTMPEVKAALQQASRQPAEPQPSIAVLPFVNMSGDKDNEYFSDGLAEEIMNFLTRVPHLKVTARTSAFAFRGKDQDIRKIAETLNVRTVLEGSVRRAGSRVRVTAQLINAADGYHIWSERFDREITDVFAVQDEIAEAIARSLQLKLGPAASARRPKPKLPAYEAYLRGRYHSFKATPEGYARARECFEEAVALDADFAAAYVALAGYHVALAFHGLRPAHEQLPLARGAAQKALALDFSLQEAHSTLAVISAAYDYDWKEAERSFRLAMSSEPVSADVRGMFAGWYLMPLDRLMEAAEQLELAVEADPLNVPFRVNLAFTRFGLDEVDRAFSELRAALAIDDGYWTVHATYSLIWASMGKLDQALFYAERASQLAPWSYRATGILAGTLIKTGDRNRGEELIKPMRDDTDRYGVPFGLMVFHVQCGEPDAAVDWLSKAIDQRDTSVLPRFVGPLIRVLRASPGWRGLLKKMNLSLTGSGISTEA